MISFESTSLLQRPLAGRDMPWACSFHCHNLSIPAESSRPQRRVVSFPGETGIYDGREQKYGTNKIPDSSSAAGSAIQIQITPLASEHSLAFRVRGCSSIRSIRLHPTLAFDIFKEIIVVAKSSTRIRQESTEPSFSQCAMLRPSFCQSLFVTTTTSNGSHSRHPSFAPPRLEGKIEICSMFLGSDPHLV